MVTRILIFLKIIIFWTSKDNTETKSESVKTEIEQKIDVNDTRKSPEGSSEHFSDAEISDVAIEKPEIPRGKDLVDDEPVSVEIEDPETQLVKTITYKVPVKNFGTEARATLDVNHFLKNATIKANIKATKLNDVIKELVVCKFDGQNRLKKNFMAASKALG